jgi:hypothetical protein
VTLLRISIGFFSARSLPGGEIIPGVRVDLAGQMKSIQIVAAHAH